MIYNYAIYAVILVVLGYIAYKDMKQRIIPNYAAALVLILSTLSFFLEKGTIRDYLFYIFLAGIPLLLLGFIVDTIGDIRKNLSGYIIILAGITAGLVLPSEDLRLKFIVGSTLFLILLIVQALFNKRKDEADDDAGSLGGGDIKLIASLGPVVKDDIMFFLFIAFMAALFFMKVKKEKNIYLAPFILLSFVVFVVINIWIGRV